MFFRVRGRNGLKGRGKARQSRGEENMKGKVQGKAELSRGGRREREENNEGERQGKASQRRKRTIRAWKEVTELNRYGLE